jgi:hypothetical protein
MSRRISNILLIALLVALTGTALVYAERGNGRFGDRLTEEQREAIHARVRELREAGASREDIHEAVREMFEGYGTEIPEAPPGERPRGRGPHGRFAEQLTEDQREAVHARVRELREAGASREDIHEAVREMFEGYGIEIPKAPPGERPRGRGPSRTGHLGDGPREGKKWGEIKGSFE